MEIVQTTAETVGQHLPWLRLLMGEFCAAQPVPYPTLDDEDLDRFVCHVWEQVRNPRFALFVAIHDGRMIGFVGGEICERQFGKPRYVGTAHWLYVVPGHRKAGVAGALIAAGQAWLAQQEITHLECFGIIGHDQWAERGFTPYLTRYHATVAQLAARPAPAVQAKSPKKPRTRKPPKKALNGSGGEAHV